MYYRQAAAAILVIDVSDKQSLRVADRWIMDIRQKTEGTDCYIILAVNKVDLPERAITPDIVADFCREKGVDSIETSALSGYQVQELFDRVCDHCMETGASEGRRLRGRDQRDEAGECDSLQSQAGSEAFCGSRDGE